MADEKKISNEELVEAAKKRVLDGEAEAGDYKIIQASDPTWLSTNNQKASYDQTVTNSGGTTTSSQNTRGTTKSETESDTESKSNSRSNSESYREIPGYTHDAAGRAQYIADRNKQLEDAYGTFSSTVGANNVRIKRERERLNRLAQKRAKVAAWTDSARVISDMISAGIGGNVYERKPDTTAKEAYEEIKARKQLQDAEDAAYAQQMYKNNLDKSLAILQNERAADELFSKQVSSSDQETEQKGHSTQSSSGESTNKSSGSSTTPQTTATTTVRPAGGSPSSTGGTNRAESAQDGRSGTLDWGNAYNGFRPW